MTYNTLRIIFGAMNTITKFRERHNLSQHDLARLLELSQAGVSHIETGRRSLSVDLAKRLQCVAKEMGEYLSLDDIFGEQAA